LLNGENRSRDEGAGKAKKTCKIRFGLIENEIGGDVNGFYNF
jgi:hypothetical protein